MVFFKIGNIFSQYYRGQLVEANEENDDNADASIVSTSELIEINAFEDDDDMMGCSQSTGNGTPSTALPYNSEYGGGIAFSSRGPQRRNRNSAGKR